MGFWGTLGKIAGVAAPIAAIPFTGGASALGLGGAIKSAVTNPNVLSSIGRTIGAGTQQSAQNRSAEMEANLMRDQLAMQAQQQHENNVLQRSQLEMQQKAADQKARMDAGNTAMRASAIQNWKPAARPSGVSNVSFVQAPTGGGMDAAKEMERQALLRQLSGEQFAPLPELSRPYQVSPMKQAGTMEKIGNFLAPAFSVGGAIAAGQNGLTRRPSMFGDATKTDNPYA